MILLFKTVTEGNMKYLKYSLRLLVPLFGLLGLFVLLTYIKWSSTAFPAFAGASYYLKVMFAPDTLNIILLNNIPYFLTALYSAAVLFTLYGALREKLARISDLLVYTVVWVVSFASALFTAMQSGFSSLVYPAFVVTVDPSQYRSMMLLFLSIFEGVFVSVAVFVVWVVFKLILKMRSAKPIQKPMKNSTTLFAVGTALMGAYVVFHFVNGLLRTLMLLGSDDTTGAVQSRLHIVLNANWLSIAAVTVAIVILVKTMSGKRSPKGLYIGVIVLSLLVLLGSLTVRSAFGTLYIASSDILLIFKVLTVVFKSISGAFIDTVASILLMIASVRALSQENEEQLPKHQITATLSKTLGVVAVVTVAMVVLSVLFGAGITFADGGSVGIVGGADGPTAQFVFFKMLFSPQSFGTHLISCLGLAAASIVLKIVSNKQKAEA